MIFTFYSESVTEEITEEIVSPEPPSLRSTIREEPIQETEGEESESPPIESDSEGLVMARKPSKRKQKAMSKPVSFSLNIIRLFQQSYLNILSFHGTYVQITL